MKRYLLLLVALVAICSANSISARLKRNALVDANRQTANAPVNYYFSDAVADADSGPLDKATKTLVLKAMDYISERTCIDFKRKTADKSRILFKQSVKNDMCNVAPIGASTTVDTVITLVPTAECASSVGAIVRLIMLGIGFAPNSARDDFATFMTVDTAINNGTAFPLQTSAVTAQNAADFKAPKEPLEYGSILSFSPDDFTDATKPIFKVVATNPLFSNTMGTGRVTFGDIKLLNDNYCTACAGTNTCKNKGYLTPFSCTECTCPDGFTGPDCTKIPKGDANKRTQGNDVTASSTLQKMFIEFGEDKKNPMRDQFLDRVDWIRAPGGMAVNITITGMASQCNPGCKTAGVEIKITDEAVAGPRFCCPEHQNKPIKSTLSVTPVISYNRLGYTSFWLSYQAV